MEDPSPLVLIGGYGFVGRNILENIAENEAFSGLSPVVLDNLSSSAPGHETLDLPNYIGNYDDDAAFDFLNRLEGSGEGRVFVFLAGETRVAESRDRPLDFIAANVVDPSRFVMRAVRPGDRFILISTAGALFDGTFEVSVKSPYCPRNFYGATKAAEELILEKLVDLRGGEFRVIRLTNVFGKYSDNKKSAVHAFIRAAISGDAVFINGDGEQSRDFSTSLMEVVAAIEEATGTTLAYEKIPAKELLATEPRDVTADGDDVKVLLGDHITPFVEGIRATHRYYSTR